MRVIEKMENKYSPLFIEKKVDDKGSIYSNARYYDPQVGRFHTENPSRKGGNWYAYCENDPINKTDPTGLEGSLIKDLWKSITNFFSSSKTQSQSAPTPPVIPAAMTQSSNPLERGIQQLGTEYGRFGVGYVARIPITADRFDCSQYVGYMFDTMPLPPDEMARSKFWKEVGSPQPNDVKTITGISPKGHQEYHEALYTGLPGNRALLHSDIGHGVRFSKDYLESHFQSEGYTSISVRYFRHE